MAKKASFLPVFHCEKQVKSAKIIRNAGGAQIIRRSEAEKNQKRHVQIQSVIIKSKRGMNLEIGRINCLQAASPVII